MYYIFKYDLDLLFWKEAVVCLTIGWASIKVRHMAILYEVDNGIRSTNFKRKYMLVIFS